MAIALKSPAFEPMAEMNTTPLIDVMLVLLIMFVITIPVASHVVAVDLPGSPVRPEIQIRPENVLTVAPDGGIAWNGVPISEAELDQTLRASLALSPEPLLKYAPDAQAPYGTSAKVIAIVKQSGVGAFGFVGNEQFRDFGKPVAGSHR